MRGHSTVCSTSWSRVLAAAFLCLSHVLSASAVTFTVNSTASAPDANPGDGVCDAGSGACTFRAALEEASNDTTCQPTTIDFSVTGRIDGGGTYAFPPTFPCVTPTLSVLGPGPSALTLAGGFTAAGAVSPVAAGVSVDVAVRDLRLEGTVTFSNGTFALGGLTIAGPVGTTGFATLSVEDSTAGDVSVSVTPPFRGSMAVTDSVVRSIASDNAQAATLRRVRVAGGGLVVTWGALRPNPTELLVEDSILEDSTGVGASVAGGRVVRTTIRNNRGGGVEHQANPFGSSLSIEDSTISGNSTPGDGGGIRAATFLPLSVSRSTIADNRAAGNGGGLAGDGPGHLVAGSIIARNADGGGGSPDCAGSVQVNASLVGSPAGGCAIGAGSLVGLDPSIGPLADNGGPTPTHALLMGSPAIDAGGVCAGTDQRGEPRPQGAACDLGAYEAPVGVVAECGNGVVEPGEQCDGGDCCAADCTVQPAGAACPSDDELCTADVCDASGVCTHRFPQGAGCVQSDAKGSLVAISDAAKDRGDELMWRWEGADSPVDFGDPASTTAFALCIADGSGALVFSAEIPAGGTCKKNKNCWKTTKRGTGYRDPGGSQDGVRTVKLETSKAGDGFIKVVAQGDELALPPLPLRLAATVRLVRDDAPVCWEARFPSAKRNEREEFRATSE